MTPRRHTAEKVAFLGDAIDGDLSTVGTTIVTTLGDRRRGRGRECLVAHYRIQFDKIIQRTSYQQPVKQVREKQ